MAHPKKKLRRKPSGEGSGEAAVIIVTKYWPPPKLVRDLAMHCFGESTADLHVIDPPSDGDYVKWEPVLKEVETLYYLHEGRVAVAVIPAGIELGFTIALKEACELLGLKAFLAIVAEEEVLKKRRRSRKRVFGPKHRKYVYLGLSAEWSAGIFPISLLVEYEDIMGALDTDNW